MSSLWANIWEKDNQRWPDTNLIRMLKGNWVRCNFNKTSYAKSNILDVGCGDASNFPLYMQCGFKGIYGTEISSEIVRICNEKFEEELAFGGVKQGTNDSIPFRSAMFDYVVSWNEFYYMGMPNAYFKTADYVKELSRVMKPGGILIFSIPMSDHGIYKNCEELGEGYVIIHNDRHDVRNGTVMKRFKTEKEIQECFKGYFDGFEFATVKIDFFDDNNELRHYIGYCKKRRDQ